MQRLDFMRDTKPAALAGLPGRHWLGLTLIVGGVVGPFAAIAFGGSLLSSMGFSLGLFGLALIRHGRAILAYSAHEQLTQDKRAPVLFLRSFEADERSSPGTSYEQRLARAVRDVGPFVAIGSPREGVPPLGAARMYVQPNADWHDTINSLLAVASLVIVQIGVSEGLLWEVEQVLSRVDPRRILLSLGLAPSRKSRRQHYEAFRLTTAQLFRQGLPDFDEKAVFLYFDAEWTVFSLRVGSKTVEAPAPSVEEQRKAILSLWSELCGRTWIGTYRL